MSEKENKQTFSEVSFDLDVSSFNDLSTIKEDSSKFFEDNQSKQDPKVPVFYLNEGVYTFRVYPDKDKNGRLRYFKRAFIQKVQGLDENGKEITIRSYMNNQIEERLELAQKNGFKDAWKYKAKEYLYVLVRLISCPTSEYTTPGKEYIMVLSKPQASKFIEFFSSLPQEQLIGSLNIKSPYYPITMVCEKGKYLPEIKELKFSSEKVAFNSMVLPTGCEWKGLDEVYITENNVPSREQLNSFNRWISNKEYMNSGLVDPISEVDGWGKPSTNFSSQQTYQQNSFSAQQNNTTTSLEEKCEIVKSGQNVGELKDVKFGCPPVNNNPSCILCVNQADCISKPF